MVYINKSDENKSVNVQQVEESLQIQNGVEQGSPGPMGEYGLGYAVIREDAIIPSGGAVDIVISQNYFLTNGAKIFGTIEGVEGELSRISDTYTFVRATSGNNVPLRKDISIFVPLESERFILTYKDLEELKNKPAPNKDINVAIYGDKSEFFKYFKDSLDEADGIDVLKPNSKGDGEPGRYLRNIIDADLLSGKEGSYYLNVANHYEKSPDGQRIYVSSQYGNDSNYGFYPEKPTKTIRQAAINAFAVQAPNTLDGNIRKDAYRTLEANRELIVEEIGLLANDNNLCGPFRDARTYRDVDDLYGAISKDLLLTTNRNFRNAVTQLFGVSNIVGNSWNREVPAGSSVTLFERMKELMWRSLYPESSDSRLETSDFPRVLSNYGERWILERLRYSIREDDVDTDYLIEGTDEFPIDNGACKYLRNVLFKIQYPATLGDLEPLISPNQANRSPFSVIRVKSGKYFEKFPIELPDNVSVFGDSLRRVEIFPRDDIKEKGCGLHQKFISNTFTSLSAKGENWNYSITVRYDTAGGNSELPSQNSVFGNLVTDVENLPNALVGRRYQIQILNTTTFASATIRRARVISNYNGSPAIRLDFEDGGFGVDEIPPDTTVVIIDLESNNNEITTFLSGDLFRGYLLLKGQDDSPIQITTNENQIQTRNTRLNPTLRFNAVPKFSLRKGDVLLILSKSDNRYELIRVEDHPRDSEGGLRPLINMNVHRLNESINLNNSYVYLAPRVEWQGLCIPRSFENRFAGGENDTLPSTEIVTNTAEVGQNAFYVGNASYVFQVVFKETTNFAFTFRRDRPRIFASPYIQNCSSITTKGGGGILVDGFLPTQPEDDFPARIIDQNTLDVFGAGSPSNIVTALNIHYDGEGLILNNQDYILGVFDDPPVSDLLAGLSEEDDNYSDIEKCKRDGRFLIDAIRWQMLRGGNDKVFDFARIIFSAITTQTQNLPNPIEARARVLGVYETVIQELRNRTLEVLNGDHETADYPQGDCSGVVSTVNNLFDTVRDVLAGGALPTRNNNVALPSVTLAKLQNSELRSFVLDAFTQINTYSGWGHLIRNNGYSQLVSTFTTFTDQGVKVESGGLINLSNSVSDFGFYGLVADGFSRTHYLSGNTFRSEIGAIPGDTPTAQIYLDPLTFNFNPQNPVYEERVDKELADYIAKYETARSEFLSLIDGGASQSEIENKKAEVEDARRLLEKEAVDSIQFNTTCLFFRSQEGQIYNFNRDGRHLDAENQVRRGISYADSTDDVSEDALSTFISENDKNIPNNFELTKPLIRIGFSVSERIPNSTDINAQAAPILEAGTEVRFFITTTLTSSAHGFEYVGSGNDYTNALPENGGVPDSSKQVLETNGGRVFTSSTDVRGDFRVGNFFTVRQSTGEVTFNPSSLELINLKSIGPFRSNGVIGREIIRDLTNDFNELLPGNGKSTDRTTISTVNAIKGALSETFDSLSNRVETSLLRSESNAKLLEAVQSPIPDYGTWAAKHSIYHRSLQVKLSDTESRLQGIDSKTAWGVVRSLDSYLYEFGGNVPNLVSEGANEFINRASYTLNMVIDSSESMSQSGNYWQIKYDLLNFFYNSSSRDSIGIYRIGSSSNDSSYITVNGSDFLEEVRNSNATVELFDSNSEGSRNIGFYDEDFSDRWYQESITDENGNVLYKVAEGEVFNVLDDPENKIGIQNIKGYIKESLVIIVNRGTGNEVRDTIATVEFGILPSIFNLNRGVDDIRVNLPEFDFDRALVNGLLKEVGVVLPTTNKVLSDNLLELVVWEEANLPSFETISEPNIAPGPSDWTDDLSEIWTNDVATAFTPIAGDYDFSSDPERSNTKWFYADEDPQLNLENNNIVSKFEYLPPRTSVSGRNARDYRISSIIPFSKYDSDSNPEGWMTPEDISLGNFLREQKSTPELDVAVVTHSGWFGSTNARYQARAMRNFMQELDILGFFDWKVAKSSFKAGVDQPARIRDFYLEDISEPPRRNIFSDSANNWRWGNDRQVISGISDSENILTLVNLQFAPDNSGVLDPNLSTGDTTSAGIEGETTFWVGLPGNANAPIHKGTSITIRDRDTTINVNYDPLPLQGSISQLEVSDSQTRLGPGDIITTAIRSNNQGQRHSVSYSFTATVNSVVEPRQNTTISITPTNGILEMIGITDINTPNSSGEPYRTNGTLGINISNATTSGDNHPLYDYQLDFDREFNEDTGDFDLVSRSFNFTNRTRSSIAEQSLDCVVDDVVYTADRIWIKVNTTLADWTKEVSGVLKSLGLTGSDVVIGNNDETLYVDTSNSRASKSRYGSTLKAISDTCLELNWRRNSYKVINVVSRYISRFEKPHVGGYYYAFNSGLSVEARVLLRRFDFVYLKYRTTNSSSLFEGNGIEATFAALEDPNDTTLVVPNNEDLYNDVTFFNFIDEFSQRLMENGAPVNAWYLGYTGDSNLNTITEDGGSLTAERGTVSRNGTLIRKSDNTTLYRLNEYASYCAVQEDLIFAQIKQLNLATRSDLYITDRLFDNPEEGGEKLTLGSLANFHIPTNFNEPTVSNVLQHRSGIREEDSLVATDSESGSGIIYGGDNISNFFTDQWDEKVLSLPFGQWRNFEEIKRSNWLKSLVTEIDSALGEGQGVLYSEFGNASGLISPENRATEAPGYVELISDNGYTDVDNRLNKIPNPTILPSPSYDRELLVSASSSDLSPGITLKGKSAIYETIAIASKDSSPNEQRLLDNNPKVTTEPRNPARAGTINVTAVLSDGLDNESFNTLVIRHFVDYDTQGNVNVGSTLENLFYELFLDENNNIQLDGSVPIQQKYIYTSELINTLHILSYARAGNQNTTNVRVNTSTGFANNNTDEQLPYQVETIDGVYNNVGNIQNLRRMTNSLDNDFPIVDSMGLVFPFYRNSGDAIPALLPVEVVDFSFGFQDLFPNPYRFQPFSFPVSQSKQIQLSGGNSFPENSKIFTSIGEEGPSITFTIDISSIPVSDNLIYNEDESPDERVVNLTQRVDVTLYSKLGYFHFTRPDNGGQSIASQLLVLDTGFGQETSPNSQVMAQNLGGRGGTPFLNPDNIVSNALRQNIIDRDISGRINYTQNPGETLVNQRINYINNAFRDSAKNFFTPGVPLISRRYLGTQNSGEYAGIIKALNDQLFFTKVDENRNNRNAIFRFNQANENWSLTTGPQLLTGGKNVEILDFSIIEFNGNPTPATILRDKEQNSSKVLVFTNDVWLTLVDTNTLIHEPISDPNRDNPYPIDLQQGDYFLNIIQTTGTNSDGDDITTTHIAIKQASSARVISTQNTLNTANSRNGNIQWRLTNYEIYEIFNDKKDLDATIFDLDSGEFTSNLVFGLNDGTGRTGLYSFDFNFDLDISNIRNNTVNPSPTFIENNPGLDFWLTADSQESMFSRGGPLYEFPEIGKTLEFEPFGSSPGQSWSVKTVIGDNSKADLVYNTPDENSNDTFVYRPATGVYAYFGGGDELLPNDSYYNNLSLFRDEASPTSGAWKKLSQFDFSETISSTSLSELYFQPGQILNGFESFEAQGLNNTHLAVLKADPATPTNTTVYIADSVNLLNDTPSTTWVSINDSNSFVDTEFVVDGEGNNIEVDIALPTEEADIGNTVASKLVKTTSSNPYLIVLFTDSESFGSNGNMLAVTPTPIPEDLSTVNWGLYTISNYQDAIADGNTYYIRNVFPINADNIILDLVSSNGDYVLSRVSITDDGSGNFTFNVLNSITYANLIDNTTGVSAPFKNLLNNESDTNRVSGATFYNYGGNNYLFIAFSSPNTDKSFIIRSGLNFSNPQNMSTFDRTGDDISYVPLVDPFVTPRYPHGDNWIRDGAIGVNQGTFLAQIGATFERDFSWNAPRYQTDDLYTSIIQTLDNYRSAI